MILSKKHKFTLFGGDYHAQTVNVSEKDAQKAVASIQSRRSRHAFFRLERWRRLTRSHSCPGLCHDNRNAMQSWMLAERPTHSGVHVANILWDDPLVMRAAAHEYMQICIFNYH